MMKKSKSLYILGCIVTYVIIILKNDMGMCYIIY